MHVSEAWEDMPSYEEALTAFAEARSLLARAEDAMQNAVQAPNGARKRREDATQDCRCVSR